MPKPIEQAKRSEAIRRYERETAQEIAADLGISPQSVYRWVRWARLGKYEPSKPTGNRKGKPYKITANAQEIIRRTCAENPDVTAAMLRYQLKSEGYNLAEITIGNWMRNNGLSKKERMKQRAEKWQSDTH